MMVDWFDVTKELPPEDGLYEVTNLPIDGCDGIMEYDGYGFLHEGVYKNPRFWKPKLLRIKRYGKINKQDE